MKGRTIGLFLVAALCLTVAGCSLGGDQGPALTTLEPAISPDGRRLAYESAVDNRLKLFVRDLATDAAEQVTEGAYDDFSPTWSPDGTAIAFASNREKDNIDIYTLDLATRDVRRLTSDAGSDMYPAWSANGRVYFNSDRTKAWQVYSVLPDGTGLTVVTANMTP
ncbi:MAG: DPP IV N-terminal domain-containing protein [Candidatus Bipolaricaulota bacterium]|nr:DPP IV N-terminal domain-containing protein [Candidatus Bipolaricaulota bacterium]